MQKNIWLAVVAAIVLGIAAWRYFGGPKEFKIATEFRTQGVCLACKAETEASYKRGESEPLSCPTCKERAFYSWWYCNECHYKFVPDLMKDGTNAPKPNPFAKCPHCNCPSVAKFDPEFQSPKNTVPLPKWPVN